MPYARCSVKSVHRENLCRTASSFITEDGLREVKFLGPRKLSDSHTLSITGKRHSRKHAILAAWCAFSLFPKKRRAKAHIMGSNVLNQKAPGISERHGRVYAVCLDVSVQGHSESRFITNLGVYSIFSLIAGHAGTQEMLL